MNKRTRSSLRAERSSAWQSSYLSYKAFLVNQVDGNFTGIVQNIPFKQPAHDEVIIKVEYSDINYKDFLSSSGKNSIVKSYPHIPGIDCAGTVEKCSSEKFKSGQKVVITGFNFANTSFGCWGQYVTAKENEVLPLTKNLSLKQAMQFGTAGLTVALIYDKIKHLPKQKALVTGASGGVGAFAILLLKKLGFYVVASSRDSNNDYLFKLGVDEIINSNTINASYEKAFISKDYILAIDNLGGAALGNIVRMIDFGGVVISCGNILGSTLNTNIFPFILRSVSLMGVSCSNASLAEKNKAWNFLAKNKDFLEKISFKNIKLNKINNALDEFKNAANRGRYLISLSH